MWTPECLAVEGHLLPCLERRKAVVDVQGPPCPASGLYLQNSFSRPLGPPAAMGPLLLRGWVACPGPLGSPSDSSADSGGDKPLRLSLSSLQKKGTHVPPESATSGSVTNTQKGNSVKRSKARNLEMQVFLQLTQPCTGHCLLSAWFKNACLHTSQNWMDERRMCKCTLRAEHTVLL